MASILEMVKFEREVPPGTIRLIKCGEFYRAYNHSAWLFQCCITEHKVIRKYVKALSEDVYYIGFPEKSLFGNIGERKSVKTDYGFDITLDEKELPDEKDYASWVDNVNTEQASKSEFHSLSLTGAEAEREVIRQLLSYPIESKSMVECVVFLAEMKKMLLSK